MVSSVEYAVTTPPTRIKARLIVTVDGRANLGVTEIDLGGPDRCLAALTWPCAESFAAIVASSSRSLSSVDRRQRARAGQVAYRLGLGGVRLSEHRLGLRERRDVRLRIDLEQHLSALSDGVPSMRHLPIQDARDLRTDLDRVRSFELGRILLRK